MSWCWLEKTHFHISSLSALYASCWEPEIGHGGGGSIYYMEVGSCYRPELLFFLRKPPVPSLTGSVPSKLWLPGELKSEHSLDL